jgi:hypothetical protein
MAHFKILFEILNGVFHNKLTFVTEYKNKTKKMAEISNEESYPNIRESSIVLE